MLRSKLLLTVGLTLVSTWVASAEPIYGRLANGEKAAAVYAFTLDQRRQVDLQMKSTDFDSYLSLLLVAEGEGAGRYTPIADDDDGGQDLNSRIQMELAPGEYRLVARSISGDGAYVLTATSYKPAPGLLIESVLGNMADARPAPAAKDPGVEAFGSRPAFSANIRVIKTGQLQVDVLAMRDMDALLMLSDSNGRVLDSSDDTPAPRHSRIVCSVAPGNYTAWVTVSSENSPHVGEFLINATFRLIENETELELKESADKDEILKLIAQPGVNPVLGQEGAAVGGLLGAAVGAIIGNQAAHATWIGREVPGFELKDIGTDQNVSLEGLRGRLVILDFWEPWCGPCLQTMPHLERLQKELAESHKLTVIGIASSDPAELKAAAERIGTTYPQLHDPGDATSEAYGVTSIPRMILVGPDGVALADVTGGKSYENLLELIEAATGDSDE